MDEYAARTRDISIHAPREGSDRAVQQIQRHERHFYPRSPRGERRAQLRPALRITNFYPRSPRGERLMSVQKSKGQAVISIHAPREGSDRIAPRADLVANAFLSTLPARGATRLAPAVAGTVAFLSTLPARGATLSNPDPP